MLEQQCNLYTSPNIDVQEINKLTSLYCKILIKLNELQDPRQKYFSNKMQKLMAEPFVIRTYTEVAQKKIVNTNLNQKRKQMQQKLSIQNEKQNTKALEHIIQTQNQKEKKLSEKVSEVIVNQQKKLQKRLQKRNMKKNSHSPLKKKSQHSIAHSSTQFSHPQFCSPSKNSSQNYLNLTTGKKSSISNKSPPPSDRIFDFKLSQTKCDLSSDSEDQYRIQKLLKQEIIQNKIMNEQNDQHQQS